MYFSVSYLILTLDEKAVMTGRVWFLLQPHKYSLESFGELPVFLILRVKSKVSHFLNLEWNTITLT